MVGVDLVRILCIGGIFVENEFARLYKIIFGIALRVSDMCILLFLNLLKLLLIFWEDIEA